MANETEKRSVHTDALATLGTIITSDEKRDAIHLAVEPTKAAEKLFPGQNVGIAGNGYNPVGIVDPFLPRPVMPGEWFWLIVYPRQINSLRHVWTHPAFKEEHVVERHIQSWSEALVRQKAHSEQWLRNFCKNNDCPSYERVMEVITSEADDGGTNEHGFCKEVDYIGFRGQDAHCKIPPEFWDHVEIVTGRKFAIHQTSFSCSC